MLVLQRLNQEEVHIFLPENRDLTKPDLIVQVVQGFGRIHLGFEADKSILILRKEAISKRSSNITDAIQSAIRKENIENANKAGSESQDAGAVQSSQSHDQLSE